MSRDYGEPAIRYINGSPNTTKYDIGKFFQNVGEHGLIYALKEDARQTASKIRRSFEDSARNDENFVGLVSIVTLSALYAIKDRLGRKVA